MVRTHLQHMYRKYSKNRESDKKIVEKYFWANALFIDFPVTLNYEFIAKIGIKNAL